LRKKVKHREAPGDFSPPEKLESYFLTVLATKTQLEKKSGSLKYLRSYKVETLLKI
jgi:hypothetical protein